MYVTSKYIDANALIEEIEHCSCETWSKGVNPTWWAQAVKVKDNIKQCIGRQPAADVQEVRHGKWDFDGIGWTCSECGEYTLKARVQKCSKFCPECGAKMDAKNEN